MKRILYRNCKPLSYCIPASNHVVVFILISLIACVSLTAVTAVAEDLIWTGAIDGTWDKTTTNWKRISDGVPAVFSDGDSVKFDNNGVRKGVTIIASGVAPSSVIFDNWWEDSDNTYTIMGGPISGTTAVRTGQGLVSFNNVNTYTGGYNANGGFTWSAQTGSLGVGPITIKGGVIFFTGTGQSVSQNIIIDGGGELVPQHSGHTTTLSGNINMLSGNLYFGDLGYRLTGNGTLKVDGKISGSGTVYISHGGAFELQLNNQNTYTGGTHTINYGTPPKVVIGCDSIGSPIVSGPFGTGTVYEMTSMTLVAANGPRTIANNLHIHSERSSGNTLAISGENDIMIGGQLSLGRVGTASAYRPVYLNVEGPGMMLIDGGIAGNVSEFVKQGTGTLKICGANTCANSIRVAQGTLKSGGSMAGRLIVNQGATLEVDRCDALSDGVGALSLGGYQTDAGATIGSKLLIDVDSSDSDKLEVLGDVTIGTGEPQGAVLQLLVDPLRAPAVGEVFTIISNDSDDPTSGMFAGLPEGGLYLAPFAIHGILDRQFRISYSGMRYGCPLGCGVQYDSGGNDVIVTVVPTDPSIGSILNCGDPDAANSDGTEVAKNIYIEASHKGGRDAAFVVETDPIGCGYECTKYSGDTFPIGTTTVTCWLVGNHDTQCSFDVTVVDTTPPSLICENVGLNTDVGTCSSSEGVIPSVRDAIDPEPDMHCIRSDWMDISTDWNRGETGVICTALDEYGNSATCSYTVNVNDEEQPTIICPSDVTINCDQSIMPDVCGNAIVSDNCDGVMVSYTDDYLGLDDCGRGMISRTWQAHDSVGNASEVCEQIINVETIQPVVVTPLDTRVQCGEDISPTSTGVASSTGGCGIVNLTYTDIRSMGCGNTATIRRTWSATDECGNMATGDQIIDVVDSEIPVAQCRSITLALNEEGYATLTANDIDDGSYDNCGVVYLSISKSAFTCTDIGLIVVTMVATDGCANASVCTATVTVVDSIAPTVRCKPLSVYLDTTGHGTATVSDIDNGSSDACGVAHRELSKSQFNCFDIGLNVVEMTVTDVNGNSAMCAEGVTVIGPEPVTYYRDTDGDGFGDESIPTQACTTPDGYVVEATDCDDTNASVYPGMSEVCDGKDNDCNGSIDEGVINCASIGKDIVVQPVDTTAGTTPVRVTFAEVTHAGLTTLTTSGTGTPPPIGFRLGEPPVYYELHTEAEYTPPATVCIDYTGIQFGEEYMLRLFHNVSGHWEDITTSLDTDNNVICGAADSFSEFAIFEMEEIDTEPPTCTCVAAGPFVLNSGVHAVTAEANDDSGIDLNTSVLSGIVDASSVGNTTVIFKAVDGAGNETTTVCSYQVQYAPTHLYEGQPTRSVLSPINADGTSVFKQKSTVTVKFRVTDAYGVSVGATGVVQSFQLVRVLTGTASSDVNEVVESTSADSSFRWSADEHLWIFNINTKKLQASKTYLYRINLNDGTAIEFQFGLK